MKDTRNLVAEQELYEVIASLKTAEEVKDLLEDLCTIGEVSAMAERLKAAKLLLDGNTYEQVTSQIEISSATLSRVSKCVKYGKGYRAVLVKDKKEDI